MFVLSLSQLGWFLSNCQVSVDICENKYIISLILFVDIFVTSAKGGVCYKEVKVFHCNL